METAYKIVQLSDDNIKDLLPLYKDAVGSDIEIGVLKNKFNTNFTGYKNLGFIAYAPNGEAAAFYGVLPCYFIQKGEKILVAQSGNTMTHTKHRRKNLFVILALHTYEYCKGIGIQLVFGFPNEFSYPGFVKKLNWTHQENIQAYLTKTLCIPYLRLTHKLKIATTFHLNKAEKVFAKLPKGSFPFTTIQQMEGDHYPDRSEDFYRYKSYHPKYLIKIKGKNVWVKVSTMYLYVGDIEACSKNEFKKIIKKLHQLCFWAGIPHLRFHTSPNSKLSEYLSEVAEKYSRSYPIGYVQLGEKIIDMGKIKFTLGDYDTF